MESTWIAGKLFANPRSTLESLQIPYQGTHQFLAPSAAGEAPALVSTGRLVAREEERTGSAQRKSELTRCVERRAPTPLRNGDSNHEFLRTDTSSRNL